MEQQKLPNVNIVIVMGIASIVLCWCYGILGLILAVVGLILANKATSTYKNNPELYSDYGTLKIGKVLLIVGIILNILFILFVIWIISIVGWENLQNQELMQERLEEYFNQ